MTKPDDIFFSRENEFVEKLILAIESEFERRTRGRKLDGNLITLSIKQPYREPFSAATIQQTCDLYQNNGWAKVTYKVGPGLVFKDETEVTIRFERK